MSTFNVEEWMNIAKEFGCIFKNIEFIRDENDYVRAVASNPSEEFYIEVKFPVLQYEEDIVIEDFFHGVKEEKVKDPNLRKMLNEYLDFIFSETRLERLAFLINEFNKLPKDIKTKLLNTGLIVSLFGNKPRKILKKLLLHARTINMKGKPVFMPFIDFINHDLKEGVPYGIEEDFIYVKGMPSKSGEIFAIYNNHDDFGFLNTYFFLPNHPLAYSIAMKLNLDDGKELIVRRQIGKIKEQKEGLRVPEYNINGNVIEVSHLWIGSIYTPRRPFWSFRLLWERYLGRKDTVKVFTLIKSFNLRFFINLLKDIDKLEESFVKGLLKKATLNVLTAISHTFEEP